MDELAKRFAELAEKFGPSVVDAAKAAARTAAYSSLVSAVFWLASGLLLLAASRFLWRKIKEHDEYDWTDDFPLYAGLVICTVLGCAFMMGAAWIWVDPWTWMTISHPEAWIAKKALGL